MYDLLFRNVEIIDGTGSARFRGEVGIKDDTIVAVGTELPERAHEVLDGRECVLAPGFIDIHTHSDFPLFIDPRGESKVRQGVTTEVIGNCGGWAAPLEGEARSTARRQLESFGFSDEIPWRDMTGYLEIMTGKDLGMNVAALVGHGAIRASTMNYDDRAPDQGEMQKMRRLLREAMEAGAFGMSTGIYYAPGSYADADELTDLCTVLAEYDGLHASHIRDESDYNIGLHRAIDEVLDITRRSGSRLQISHLKTLGPAVWGQAPELLKKLALARTEGLEVAADQYPYAASGSSITGALIPRWAQAGGREQLLGHLDNPEMRGKIGMEVQENLRRRGGADRLMIASYDPDTDLEGYTLEEAAQMKDTEPAEAALQLLAEADASFVSFVLQEEDVRTILGSEYVMVASDGRAVAADGPLSGGHPHPRYFGTFPRVLGKYCRDEGLLQLENGVHKMTQMPADRLGLTDRGTVRPGMKADLVLFSAEEIADRATFEKPKAYPAGIRSVLVNGQVVIREGKCTGRPAGQVLRRGQ